MKSMFCVGSDLWLDFLDDLTSRRLIFIRDQIVLGGFCTFYYWPAKSEYLRTKFYWDNTHNNGIDPTVAVITEYEAKGI